MQSRGNQAGSADERLVHPDWRRAYPRRSRPVSGAETCGQVDLVGPVAGRPGRRAAVDLVRAGWAMRWREHPPMLDWLRYRLPGLDRPVRAVRTLSGPVLAGALVVPEPADVTPCPALP